MREILDRHGLKETKIVASGDLNEFKIEELLAQGAPIDLFGVGTDLATSRDVPTLSVVYKLVEIEHDGRVEYKTKFSEQKVYSPGRKQVFRFSRGGEYLHDVIACCGEDHPEAEVLLHLVMHGGRRLESTAPIQDIRARTLAHLDRLPEPYHALRGFASYPVMKSAQLDRLLKEVRERYVEAPQALSAQRESRGDDRD